MRPEHWLYTIPLRLRSLFRRDRLDHDLDDELRDHIARKTEEYAAKSLPLTEARRQALLELRGIEQTKEACRDARRVRWLQDLAQDFRFGLRMLRKSPAFTTVAVLTLALGIGANAAIFSIVDAVLLRSLPFKNPGRLVDITEYNPGKVDSAGVPFPDYLVWKQQNTVFDETAAYFLIQASNDTVLGAPSSTVRERSSTVTNSFFTILGVQPALGHGFSAADENPGGPRLFLISDAVWRGLFGGDPRAIGKTYLVDGENYTLSGVMPPGFDFPKGCGVWVPTSTLGTFGWNDRISHPYHVLGRLRPAVTLQQAQAQLESIQHRLAQVYPDTNAGWHVRAQPLLNAIVGNVQTSLFVLLGAVGFILLIACANVVNLMLARASVREKEFAVRAALGATRTRLLRQNLAESLLLVMLSALAAIAVAKWGLVAIVALTQIHLARMQPFELSLPVLLFIGAAIALVTIIVGIAPAVQASRRNASSAFPRTQRSGSASPKTRRLRHALVISQVALAILLLCGAGLMLRSFVRLNRVNPGFSPEHLLTFKIALPGAAYRHAAQTKTFLSALLPRLQSLPGVEDAAATSTLPLSGESDWGSFQIAGRVAPNLAQAPAVDAIGVTPTYFHLMRIPLLRGRLFTAADVQNNDAFIINEAMAKKFWPGQDPIGQRIGNAYSPRWGQIVGIVADVKGAGLDQPAKPEMYSPYSGAWYVTFILRTQQSAATVIPEVRGQVAAIDKGVPIYQVATMDQLLSRSVAPQRFNLFLLGLFAALALVLAAIGIYGVLSFGVAQRTHEIGIRMALGARPNDVLRLIIRQGLQLVFIGLALGIAASFVLTRFMASLLFEIRPADPTTFAVVALVLTLIALLASYMPARRAMKVDPVTALRCE
ncbi:MAG TPA: ABC transporter permease [Candidatus Acidoferrales bacterium]|nr:ABC transporter permease [Candidatus Acidoferrales bacterium]